MRKTCSRLTSGVFTAAHFLPSVFLGLFIDCCLISLRWLREPTGCQSSLSGGGVARRSASVCFYQRIKQFDQTSAGFFPSSPFHVKSRFKRLAVTAGFLRVFFFFSMAKCLVSVSSGTNRIRSPASDGKTLKQLTGVSDGFQLSVAVAPQPPRALTSISGQRSSVASTGRR